MLPIGNDSPPSGNRAARQGRSTARPWSSASNVRNAVNYLRHECTTYDGHLAESFGAVDTNPAHAVIKNRALRKIAEKFPVLAAEAESQMIDAAGLEPP